MTPTLAQLARPHRNTPVPVRVEIAITKVILREDPLLRTPTTNSPTRP
jgi:hypothetical protein